MTKRGSFFVFEIVRCGMLSAVLGLLLNPRVIGAIAFVAAIGYGGYKVYDWVYEKGVAAATAKLQPQIDKLKGDVKKLENELAEADSIIEAHTATIKSQREAHTVAVKLLKEEHAKALATQKRKLDTMEINYRTAQEKLNESVRVYVPPKADAACTVNRGFVSLYNSTLQARTNPDGSTQSPGVPASGPENADAPSGVALSVVAATTSSNNLECSRRGEVLQLWQDWYRGAYESWRKAVEAQGNFRITAPAALPVQ